MRQGITGFWWEKLYLLLISVHLLLGFISCLCLLFAFHSSVTCFHPSAMCSSMYNYYIFFLVKFTRYKKLLSSIDITKDFFFSYSYHIMHTLQKNLCGDDTKLVPYETMFVWNAFLTRGIRSYLQNTLWTVPLVHGFFKQVLTLLNILLMCFI